MNDQVSGMSLDVAKATKEQQRLVGEKVADATGGSQLRECGAAEIHGRIADATER